MTANTSEPTRDQLLALIHTQTELIKLGLDLPAIMALATERAQAMTQADGAVIEIAEGHEMVYRAVSGRASNSLGLRLARNASLSGLCVASATALRCDDSDTDPRVDRDACLRIGIRSMVAAPLIHLGQPVGALKVLAAQPGAFGERQLRLLSLVCESLSAAMFHAARYGTEELFRRATTDALTGLANRALFYDRLRHSIAQAKREGRRLGILMLDMDGLKPINDHHGHRVGDAALKEMAKRIAAEARHSDTAARLGGDEFALILAPVETRDCALKAVCRLTERCGQPFNFENQSIRFGASVGVSICPDDGDQPDELIDRADQSMYRSKREKKAGLPA
ncbi:sensor domain-containing diguanylate cyclase [Methylomagnum ishizawai]|uniref:sensor domain-containing diguanylate cyclase n=1 Tax=Methylomagnum ishizawai TaxID=1760988 RepID=UPI001C32962A|nr:sensor domain-containing diguanylate cyclase [Methylomagnum ishizawai]BBL76460.1 hypothetical protein MishRS11D_35580 [Methylomagnum ishizawai]